jgi:hypothetical protein
LHTFTHDYCSRKELQSFLIEIGVNFSTKKWRQIFRQLDRNGDDSISVDEMIYFLFDKNKETIIDFEKKKKDFSTAVLSHLPGYGRSASKAKSIKPLSFHGLGKFRRSVVPEV